MKFCIYFLIIPFIISCKQSNSANETTNDNLLKLANRLSIIESGDSIQIISGGTKISFAESQLPLKTAMVIPTSAIAYMDELDLIDKITGISQPDFIYNSKVLSLIDENKIAVIGSFEEIFVEKILVNQPDVIFTTSSPTLSKFHAQLERENIKIIYVDEYEELDPLARAEYVKLFGVLFGKEQEASELFQTIVENYNQIVAKVSKSEVHKPSVFVNRMYGDIWYMPGGKSFQARLIEDAGGDYVWASDDSSGSLNLSFESVFERAGKAAVWINAGDFPDQKSLLASYKNYEWLSAFRNGRVYNWNNKISKKGANDYFETGTARPDLVLKDLAAIFHPDLFPDHQLIFYKRLD